MKVTNERTGREVAEVSHNGQNVFLFFGRMGVLMSPDEACELTEALRDAEAEARGQMLAKIAPARSAESAAGVVVGVMS